MFVSGKIILLYVPIIHIPTGYDVCNGMNEANKRRCTEEKHFVFAPTREVPVRPLKFNNVVKTHRPIEHDSHEEYNI